MKHVIELTAENPAWDDFLARYEHLIFHTPKFFHFFEKTFAQKLLYLAVVSDDNITLVFPSVLIKHLLFGRKIISVGYLEYGGFAGEKEDIPLVLEYIKNCYGYVSYIEIRQGLEKFDGILSANTIATIPYRRFLLPLASVDTAWKGIQKHKRKAIKKAEEDGVVICEFGIDDINHFYELYLRNMRSFGSPPYGRHFFLNFIYMGMGKIFGAFINGKLVAALAGYCYQTRIHIIIAVSDDKYLINRPNDAVHWAFIKYGCENGYTLFDFGRTREGSGQHEYKEKFGAEMHPLHHYYLLFNTKDIPHMDPTDKKMKVAAAAWKHLPLFVTEKTGHWLREGLGI